MHDNDSQAILDTLREILDLQRRQYEMAKEQYERAERLQDRAEEVQEKSANLVAMGKKLFLFVIPILIVLILYVSWLIFSL